MWNAVLRLLAPFATPLLISAGLAVGAGAMSLYDAWIDDPAVARAARQDYVHKSEKLALEAQLELEKKLRLGAQNAAIDYAARLDQAERAQAAAAARTEQEIADYEAKLEAAGRSCRLDGADIDWLRKP